MVSTQENPLELQESLVKTSFFDDVNDEKTQLDKYPLNVFWVTAQEYAPFAKMNPHANSNPLMEGYLLSRSKKANNMKKRYYALYDDRLVCFKVKKKKKCFFFNYVGRIRKKNKKGKFSI